MYTQPLTTLHTLAARTGGASLTSAVIVKVDSWIDMTPSLYNAYVVFTFSVTGD